LTACTLNSFEYLVRFIKLPPWYISSIVNYTLIVQVHLGAYEERIAIYEERIAKKNWESNWDKVKVRHIKAY